MNTGIKNAKLTHSWSDPPWETWSCSMNTGIDNAEELIIYNNEYWNWECRNCKHKMMMMMMMMQIKYSNYSFVFRCRWRSWKRDLLFTQCSKVQIDAAAEWKESDMNHCKGSKQVHKIFFCSGKEEEQEEEEKEEEGYSQFLEKLVVLNENWIWECRNCNTRWWCKESAAITVLSSDVDEESWKRDLLCIQCWKVQRDAAAAEWEELAMDRGKGGKQVHKIFFLSRWGGGGGGGGGRGGKAHSWSASRNLSCSCSVQLSLDLVMV